MRRTHLAPLALSALLLASPFAMAAETGQSLSGTATNTESATAIKPAAGTSETSAAGAGAGMTTGSSAATGAGMKSSEGSQSGQSNEGGQEAEESTQPGYMGPGMMMGGPGMAGCPYMMGGGAGMGPGYGMGGPGAGRSGCMGMMHHHHHHGTCGGQKTYNALMNRLDLMDARMAKIETLLEGLMQR